MFEDAPVALRETVRSAEEEARALGHGYIGTEHLLLGLLRRNGTRAATHMAQAGVTHHDFKARIEEIIGQSELDMGDRQLPWTTRSAAVCRRVLADAGRSDPQSIGTEHVLRAVLRSGESMTYYVLRDLGVDAREIAGGLRRPRPDDEGMF